MDLVSQDQILDKAVCLWVRHKSTFSLPTYEWIEGQISHFSFDWTNSLEGKQLNSKAASAGRQIADFIFLTETENRTLS